MQNSERQDIYTRITGQIEGLAEHFYIKPEPKFTAVERIDHAEAFFAARRPLQADRPRQPDPSRA